MADSELERILRALEESRCRYLVVGGVAVVLHGHLRFTADLDLVIALEADNLRNALDSLQGLGYRPRAPVSLEEFADPEARGRWVQQKGLTVFSLWSPSCPATEIDIFAEEPFPFEDAYRRAVRADLGVTTVAVVHLSDLIAMKRAAGRPQDIEDVRALESIQRQEEQGGG
jgi:hypothetical protein